MVACCSRPRSRRSPDASVRPAPVGDDHPVRCGRRRRLRRRPTTRSPPRRARATTGSWSAARPARPRRSPTTRSSGCSLPSSRRSTSRSSPARSVHDTAHSVELTKQAAKLGVHGILSLCPYYSRPLAGRHRGPLPCHRRRVRPAPDHLRHPRPNRSQGRNRPPGPARARGAEHRRRQGRRREPVRDGQAARGDAPDRFRGATPGTTA